MLKTIFVLILIFTGCLCASAQTGQSDGKMVVTSQPQPEKPSKTNKNAVEGTVRLRVTFLASGKIGDIVLVEGADNKKLIKAGLVDEAVKAVKLIRFEPAKKNGKSVTTMRTIEYKFTVY